MMKNRKVYIATIRDGSSDGVITGHYVAVAKNYLHIFGNSCIVAGGLAFENYFKRDELCLLPYDVPTASFIDKIRSMINCIKLFNIAQGQTIVLQQCSVVTSFVAIWLFYHNKSRLFLIQYNTVGLASRLNRLLYRLARHKIAGIICPTDRVGQSFGRPYCVVTDYIRISQIPRQTYKQKEFDFCVMGTIWPDKGVVEVARKLQATPYKLLIVGAVAVPQLKDELDKISRGATNITMILKSVSSQAYEEYIRRSRYCILNYRGCYDDRSSGVILDMIFNGTPVVAHRCEATRMIEDNGCGLLYDDLEGWNPESVLSEEIYEKYQDSIQHYWEHQQLLKERLRVFVELNDLGDTCTI